MNQLLANIPFTCECGETFMLTKLQHRTERCADCREEHEENKRLRYNKTAAKKRAQGPRCSCGCGEPRGEGLRKLSKKCYKKGEGVALSEPSIRLDMLPLSEQILLEGGMIF